MHGMMYCVTVCGERYLHTRRRAQHALYDARCDVLQCVGAFISMLLTATRSLKQNDLRVTTCSKIVFFFQLAYVPSSPIVPYYSSAL